MLVFQRYGRGKAFAFTPQDSWVWQMHATMPVDDLTHENFWRQLLRWLVDGVPDQVEPRHQPSASSPAKPRMLTANVVDPSFVELNDAVGHGHGHRTRRRHRRRADVVGRRAGRRVFRGDPDQGARLVRGAARGHARRQDVGSAVTHFRAAPGDAEYFDATMRAGTLRRIAEETGGRFYDGRASPRRWPTICATPDAA